MTKRREQSEYTIRGWKGISQRLAVSVRTAQRLERAPGGLPVFRKFGRVYIREQDIERWMREHFGAVVLVE